jgi:hypothetical protein
VADLPQHRRQALARVRRQLRRFNRLQEHLGREQLAKQGFVLDEEKLRPLAATLPKIRKEKGREVEKSWKDLLREARKKLKNAAARKLGDKLFLDAFRHTFAQRLLLAGKALNQAAEPVRSPDARALPAPGEGRSPAPALSSRGARPRR